MHEKAELYQWLGDRSVSKRKLKRLLGPSGRDLRAKGDGYVPKVDKPDSIGDSDPLSVGTIYFGTHIGKQGSSRHRRIA